MSASNDTASGVFFTLCHKIHFLTVRADTPMQFYNYPGPPTKWVCFVFVILFGVSFCECSSRHCGHQSSPTSLAVWHCYQTLRYRLWFAIPTIDVAAFGEVIGWVGRLWSSNDATLKTPFMIQCASSLSARRTIANCRMAPKGQFLSYWLLLRSSPPSSSPSLV